MPPLRGAGEHSLVGARRLLMMRRHNARFYVTLPGRAIVPHTALLQGSGELFLCL